MTGRARVGSLGQGRPPHERSCSSLITLVPAALLLWSQAAAAHIPQLSGKLVDCISHSDVIVAGTVDQVTDVTNRIVETTLKVEHVLAGEVAVPSVTFRGGARFAPHERYVVFLRRASGAFEGVQAAGTLFNSRPQDDGEYQQAIDSVRAALRAPPDAQVDRLRAALIPALRAAPQPLRYHAALELAALAHHGPLNADNRQVLAALVADPGFDPALRPLVTALLQPQSKE